MKGERGTMNGERGTMKKTRLSSVASLLAAGVLMGGCMGDFGGEIESESEGVAAQEPNVGGGEALGEAVGEAQKAFIPGVWTAWQKLPLPPAVATQQSPTISSRGNGTFDVFVLGTNKNIYMQSYAHGRFGHWANLGTPPGVTFVAAPDAVSSDANSFAVAALGTNGTYYVNTWTLASNRMSGWKPVPGTFRTYGPAMSSRGSGMLDFYGAGPDGKAWTSGLSNGNPAYSNGQLGSPLNQPLTSKVTSVSWDRNTVHLYARGSDNSMYSRWWSAAGWNPQGWVPVNAAGKFTSGFGVASWAPGHLDVFGLGTDSKVYQIQYDAGWTGFTSVGAPPVGVAAGAAPDAVSSGSGRIHLVVRGSDNQPWVRSFTAFNVNVGGIRRTPQVSGYYYQGVTVKSDGTVWAMGGNQSNLGVEQVQEPTKALTDVVAVASGLYHNLALKRDGTVWTWSYGKKATRVEGLKDVVAVEAGADHNLAIMKDGTLWAWGGNSKGQLGTGTKMDSPTPKQVLKEVVSVSGGEYHTLAVRRDGTVWAWGSNDYGKLGYATTGGSANPSPRQVPNLTGFVQVSAGQHHSAALKSDGMVWTWGYNYFGQLGEAPSFSRETPRQIKGLTGVVAISAGYHATYQLALKGDGTLWNWTTGALGKLMDGVVAMEAGHSRSLAVKSDGTLWYWTMGNGTQVQVPTVSAKL